MTELMGPRMPWRWWSFHRSGKIKGVVTSSDGLDNENHSPDDDKRGKDDPGRKPAQQRG